MPLSELAAPLEGWNGRCVCGATPQRRISWTFPFGGPGFDYLVCDECGTLLLTPRPTAEQLTHAYETGYFGAGQHKFSPPIEALVGLSRHRRIRLADGLLRQVTGGRPGRVLDLGCGDGRFLDRLRALGHEVVGTELSEATSRRAAGIPGIDLRLGALDESAFPPESFHLVSAWHVLEHLPDPGLTLAQCRRWLAPGGALLIAVPNAASWQARIFRAAWFHLDPPRHLYQYDEAALRRILGQTGFDVAEVHHFTFGQNVYGVLQSALNCLGNPPAELYELLKGNRRGAVPWRLLPPLLLGAALFPPSFAFALCEALAGRGGTIELISHRRP